MITKFNIFTLLYKESKRTDIKVVLQISKGKTQKQGVRKEFLPLDQGEICSSSHQFMLQRKGIYGRNESDGKAKSGAKKQRHCRKGR